VCGSAVAQTETPYAICVEAPEVALPVVVLDRKIRIHGLPPCLLQPLSHIAPRPGKATRQEIMGCYRAGISLYPNLADLFGLFHVPSDGGKEGCSDEIRRATPLTARVTATISFQRFPRPPSAAAFGPRFPEPQRYLSGVPHQPVYGILCFPIRLSMKKR
jgi:hypothetical protein